MKFRIVISLLLFVLLAGCSDEDGEKTDNAANVFPRKGSVTADGGLVVFDWLPGEGVKGRRSVVLRDGYGMMMFYNAYAENSVVRYELYTYKTKEVFKTTSPAEFKEKLADIGKGQKLHYYNTCAGGTHHALDLSVLEGIKSFCKDRGVVFQKGDDEVIVVCMCP